MHIDPYILAFSRATGVVTSWMGYWWAKQSRSALDFFVPGRSVSVGWNGSAISGVYLSAASFLGIAGMLMSSGYDALWYPACYASGYLFVLLFSARALPRRLEMNHCKSQNPANIDCEPKRRLRTALPKQIPAPDGPPVLGCFSQAHPEKPLLGFRPGRRRPKKQPGTQFGPCA